jgi:hypothetical protein
MATPANDIRVRIIITAGQTEAVGRLNRSGDVAFSLGSERMTSQ